MYMYLGTPPPTIDVQSPETPDTQSLYGVDCQTPVTGEERIFMFLAHLSCAYPCTYIIYIIGDWSIYTVEAFQGCVFRARPARPQRGVYSWARIGRHS
jgi:hypothetical protein